MSVWRGYSKRFQKDLNRYPKFVRDALVHQQNKYALPTMEQPMSALPPSERKTELKQIGFTAGDLAYVTEGPKKGTITRILRYMSEYDGALLMDVTTKKLVPKNNWVENQTTHVFDFPDLTPASHFKLAAKDKDAETGEIYYIVADELEMKGTYYDDRYKKWMPKRFVKNHPNIEIPWPTPEELPEDDLLSTPPTVAHETTYELQTLAKAPIPAEALSQLRNPHSHYKKRYLSEYQSRVMAAPEMPMSAAQKAYLAKKAIADEKRAPLQNLSKEVQDFIGEKMAAHINKIDNPHLLEHLEELSNVKIPDFSLTQQKIANQANK